VTVGQQASQLLDFSRQFLASEAAGEQIFRQVNLYLGEIGIALSRQDMAVIAERLQLYFQELTLTSVPNFVSSSVALILHVVVVFVAVFYLLVDGVRFKEFVFELSPLPNEEDQLIVTRFQNVTRGILVGNGLGSVIQSVLAGAAMWAAGIPGVAFWVAIMAVLAFLPLIGISFVTVPASIYLYWSGKPVVAIAFFLFCGTVSLFVDSIVKAWLIGARTRMHDLVVFLAIVGGIAAFGVMGLLYGPLLVAVFLTLTTLYLDSYHHKLATSWRRVPDSPPRR
jgi:predicted PurR-regulated permease PerM